MRYCSITERGLKVADVTFQTQIGSGPISEFMVPTRGPGDPSVVKGGILGPGEYECDVQLDSDRTSYIVPRVTFENGQVETLGPFGFDRDKRPNLLRVDLLDTVLRIQADTDTKSIRVFDKFGTWEYVLDGQATGPAGIDVGRVGTNGVAGLSSTAASTFTVQARSQPILYVDGSTLIDSRDVLINGSAATPAAAEWGDPGVVAEGPTVGGGSDATIKLNATASPVAYTTRVSIAMNADGSTPPVSDETANLSPALTVPPSVQTSYTWDSGYPRLTPPIGAGAQLVTMVVQAEILDGSGVVVDTLTTQASWYAAS